MLAADGSALDPVKIDSLLEGSRYQIECVAEVGSTNDLLKMRVREGRSGQPVVIANQQTAGRGRLQRRWHGPAGLGLYLSVFERTTRPSVEMTRWTVGAGVAAAEACRSLTGLPIELKWPNDLIHDGRKLGGVLTETVCSSSGPTALFVGVGINVGHQAQDLLGELKDRAISIRLALNGQLPPEREAVAAAFLDRWSAINDVLQKGEWDLLRQRWLRLSIWPIGTKLDVFPSGQLDCGDPESGRLEGIDSNGALLVQSGDGRLIVVTQADSVRAREV